jgi:4-hydroxy-tetrahydrodipicolinate synthase
MEARPDAPFGQVVTAALTPFDDQGAVDYAAFWRMLRYLADNGSDGVVVAGTTGESPTLSHVEKVALFKAAMDAVGDRIKVVAGTGTYDTKESVALTEKAAEAGCHGAMAVTPYYSKPPQEGLYRHFVAIAEATDLPLMVYNIPGRTARIIEIDTLVRLAEHPKIIATKDAVYAGSDGMTRGIVEAGGVGVVSVASHLVGTHLKRLIETTIEGNLEAADRLHEGLLPVFESLFVEPSPMPLKAGMNALWGSVGQPRLPLVPASDETTRRIEAAMESVQDL